MQLGAETSVNTEELLVHNGSEWQAAKRFDTGLIDGLGVLVLAFELKGKVVCQMTALVVASQEPQRLGVVNLERPEVQNTFDREVTTVNIVAEEEVARLGRVATDLEQLHQVVVLAVNVTAHGDGSVHLEQVGLCAQDVGTSLENEESLLFGQTTLAVKMLLEKVDVGLGACAVREELLVCGLGGGGCLNVCRWRKIAY